MVELIILPSHYDFLVRNVRKFRNLCEKHLFLDSFNLHFNLQDGKQDSKLLFSMNTNSILCMLSHIRVFGQNPQGGKTAYRQQLLTLLRPKVG